MSKKKKKILALYRRIGTLAFLAAMALGCFVGALFFFRPSTSTVEKRKLTAFPSFDISGFLDGSFFSGVSTWYADTYPGRDTLIAANQKVQSKYGIESSTQMVGTAKQSDEIPTEKGASTKKKTKKEKVEVPTQNYLEEDMQANIMGNLYVKDGAAYSMYYFLQEAVERYTDAINHGADQLEGTTTVYSILLPNQSGMLDKKTQAKLGGADQEEAIDYFISLYNDNVHSVDAYDALWPHRDEYLYFRTDHHWTTKGAYYAYKAFCEEKGIKPHKLSYFKKTMTFEPFLGTFYTELQNSEMAANPDSVTAYVPNGTNELTYWNEDGTEISGQIIQDVSDWDESSGYYCFICGDKPLTIIENPKVDDGSSCLVVKESYGNAFIPFLVDHYSKVYIIDFRYTDKNIVDYCKEEKIDDLIIINNITLAGSDSVSAMLEEELS
ncbi:MAG: hypothetical protein J6D36_01465 [Erysipelotrichaceae bacterium]|nr:hypothetical protein [Erysipelotrichaceae bacterium]